MKYYVYGTYPDTFDPVAQGFNVGFFMHPHSFSYDWEVYKDCSGEDLLMFTLLGVRLEPFEHEIVKSLPFKEWMGMESAACMAFYNKLVQEENVG